MGKSEKNVSNKALSEMKKIPTQVKDQLKPLIQKLLNKCSGTKTLTKKEEWEEMNEIFDILGVIQNIEKNYKIQFPDRRLNWEKFYAWCSENGAEFSNIEVKEIKDGNFGVISKKDIKKDESFLIIPRKIVMSEISAKNSRLGPLISSDLILRHMPNVQVALHLLTEFLDPKSFWLPYISILPSSYSTILYFSWNEIKELEKTSVIGEVFKVLKSVARQYCYFFQLFQRDAYGKALNISQYFTYDLYRWAVSSTMTRQNILPCSGREQQVTSLVPLFDMCNHCNGKLSTDFNLEQDVLVSYAVKDFAKGEEVCMFYGPRINAEFMVHNAFVYMENESDALEIKLGISKNDPLHDMKNQLGNKLKVPLSGPFYLHKRGIVSDELLKFLEIYVMKSDELERLINSEEDVDLLSEEFVDLKKRAHSFLKDRANLLLKAYGSSLEDDENLLNHSVSESTPQLLSLQLRICEKKMLSSTMDYCMKKI